MGICNAISWNWDRILSLRSSWVYREKNQNAKNKNKLKTQRIFNWLSVRENGNKRWKGKHLIRRSHMWCCQLIKKEVACSCSTLWWRTERGGTILNSWTLWCRRNIPQSSYFHPETLGNCNWWKHTHVVTKIRFKIVSSINHTMTPTAHAANCLFLCLVKTCSLCLLISLILQSLYILANENWNDAGNWWVKEKIHIRSTSLSYWLSLNCYLCNKMRPPDCTSSSQFSGPHPKGKPRYQCNTPQKYS